jgi:hypothetical protein
LTLTFGLGRREKADRTVVEWPSGAVQEAKGLAAGEYLWVEGKNPARSGR